MTDQAPLAEPTTPDDPNRPRAGETEREWRARRDPTTPASDPE